MRITYYAFRFFIFLFQMIPFAVLPIQSRCLAFVLRSIVGYRKKVVMGNIVNSFQERDRTWHEKICKLFYRNLASIILESIKGFSMRKKDLLQRYRFVNPELLNDFFDREQSVIGVGAHYANWEWGIMAAPMQLKHRLVSFYTPLTNPFIDAFVRKVRGKSGTVLIPTNEVRRAFRSSDDTPTIWFFGADQSPSSIKGAHWIPFLNQDTPCNKGPEFFASIYDMPVVYFDVQRKREGHYEVQLSVLETHPKKTTDGEVTSRYFRKLEQIVVNKPEDYLWSHRRWKHKRQMD